MISEKDVPGTSRRGKRKSKVPTPDRIGLSVWEECVVSNEGRMRKSWDVERICCAGKYGSLHEWCSQANSRNPHAARREMEPRGNDRVGTGRMRKDAASSGLQGSWSRGCVVLGERWEEKWVWRGLFRKGRTIREPRPPSLG